MVGLKEVKKDNTQDTEEGADLLATFDQKLSKKFKELKRNTN